MPVEKNVHVSFCLKGLTRLSTILKFSEGHHAALAPPHLDSSYPPVRTIVTKTKQPP